MALPYPLLACRDTNMLFYRIKCFIHPNTCPLAPSLIFSRTNRSEWVHQAETVFDLDLDHTFYLRPASAPLTRYHFKSSLRLPPFINRLRWRRRGEGNYMDLCFCFPCALSTQKTFADFTLTTWPTQVEWERIWRPDEPWETVVELI